MRAPPARGRARRAHWRDGGASRAACATAGPAPPCGSPAPAGSGPGATRPRGCPAQPARTQRVVIPSSPHTSSNRPLCYALAVGMLLYGTQGAHFLTVPVQMLGHKKRVGALIDTLCRWCAALKRAQPCLPFRPRPRPTLMPHGRNKCMADCLRAEGTAHAPWRRPRRRARPPPGAPRAPWPARPAAAARAGCRGCRSRAAAGSSPPAPPCRLHAAHDRSLAH